MVKKKASAILYTLKAVAKAMEREFACQTGKVFKLLHMRYLEMVIMLQLS
ncbi:MULTISPECIES: hypothetical protein [unclassified Neochlamydia]|nr:MULTISPECIES: hypothetical protein [unclassified Neochlamydia]MBS4169442.1 hypothetical protein [Neochlamydia sp. AcF95]